MVKIAEGIKANACPKGNAKLQLERLTGVLLMIGLPRNSVEDGQAE